MDGRHGDLGELLRTHRVRVGLTQEALAERAGVSARAVSDIERGLRTKIYRDTTTRLATALGLDDDQRAELMALAQGRLAAAMADELGPSARSVALPGRLDRLIGRDADLRAIVATLRSPGVRLVTLTGTGGIGKTRLALEVADRVAADFEDGARVVPLAGTREPGLLAATLARSLGIHAERGSVFDAVRRHLERRHLLIVLDNFEHLLEAAPLVVDILAGCPQLVILVTSRAPLRVSGEHEIEVRPLALPGDDRQHIGALPLAGSAAVELFLDRARAANPGFVSDAGNARAVRDITLRLEGLPLAIELAAGRLTHVGIETLRDHLEHELDVLSRGPRDLPPRQRAMRATIGWSYELLDPEVRRLFARLAVFAGGFDLEAAGDIGDLPSGDALETVSVLVDHHLVALDPPTPTHDRYAMLEVIRSFAEETALATGELETARQRHAAWFLELAARAQPGLLGAEQAAWYDRLDREQDNLRVALRWHLATGEADDALGMAAALWMFWRQHGDFGEGRRWLDQALARGGSPRARLAALWGAAWLAYHQGDYGAMRRLADEHLALARAAGDPGPLRNALTEQGMLLMVEGRHADALAPFGHALDLARRLDDPWIVALSLFNLGHATVHAGDPAAGERLLTAALAGFQSVGDARFTARSTAQLAMAALVREDAGRALSLAADSLASFQLLGERWGIAEGLEIASAAATDPPAVARLAGAAAALREETATEPMPFDQAVIEPRREAVRRLADAEVWAAAWEEGRSRPVDQAATLVVPPTR